MLGKKVGSWICCQLCVPLVALAGCAPAGLQSGSGGGPANAAAGNPQTYLAQDLRSATPRRYDSGPLVPAQMTATAPDGTHMAADNRVVGTETTAVAAHEHVFDGSALSVRQIQVAEAGDVPESSQYQNQSPSFEPARPAEESPLLDQERFKTLPKNMNDAAGDAVAQNDPAPPDDLAVVAQKSNNPISDAWLLITQNDTSLLGGDAIDGTEVLNVTKFQPVISAPVFGGDWNFVIRPVLQLTSVPVNEDVGNLVGVGAGDIVSDPGLATVASDPFGRTTGLGDTVLLTLLGPNSDDGWILAGGISQIFPTASKDVLGQGKWQAGPAALVARLGNDHGGFGVEHFNFGVLPQQWWSYAGDDDRKSTSQMDLQYFLNWKASPTSLIGMTPNISVNWKADGGFDDKVSLPVGLGYIGVFRIDKLPIRWGVEAQYYLTGPDSLRKEANFRFFIAPIIPNLLK